MSNHALTIDTIPLNVQILDVAIYLQQIQVLTITHNEISMHVATFKKNDLGLERVKQPKWKQRVEEAFYALDTDFLHHYGMVKNEACLMALISYPVTDEIKKTPFFDLGKYSFSYAGLDLQKAA